MKVGRSVGLGMVNVYDVKTTDNDKREIPYIFYVFCTFWVILGNSIENAFALTFLTLISRCRKSLFHKNEIV